MLKHVNRFFLPVHDCRPTPDWKCVGARLYVSFSDDLSCCLTCGGFVLRALAVLADVCNRLVGQNRQRLTKKNGGSLVRCMN